MLLCCLVKHFAVSAKRQWVNFSTRAMNYFWRFNRSGSHIPRKCQSCINNIITRNQVHDGICVSTHRSEHSFGVASKESDVTVVCRANLFNKINLTIEALWAETFLTWIRNSYKTHPAWVRIFVGPVNDWRSNNSCREVSHLFHNQIFGELLCERVRIWMNPQNILKFLCSSLRKFFLQVIICVN